MRIQTTLALWLAKTVKQVLQWRKRQGTQLPGTLAKKVDPDILTHLEKPSHIMAVTGTNGKTTTTNFIADMVAAMGDEYITNRTGSNTMGGILSLFLDNQNVLGGVKSDTAILEVDELWSRRILPHLPVQTLTITNLFQDSYKRNGNVFYIRKRLESAIGEEMTLILNATDSISSWIKPEQKRVYFEVLPLSFEVEEEENQINDLPYCPECGGKIQWDFHRYHHIGYYRCGDCSFTNPKAQYRVLAYNKEQSTLTFEDHGISFEVPCVRKNVETIYNQIAAYATLRENGYTMEEVQSSMAKLEVTKERFKAEKVGKKSFILTAAKGFNPVALSRSISTAAKHPGRVSVYFIFNSKEVEKGPAKFLDAWFYQGDLDRVNDLDQLILYTVYDEIFDLSLKLSGVGENKVHFIDSFEEACAYFDPSVEETVYIFTDIEKVNRDEAYQALEVLKKELEKKNAL